MSLKRTEYPQSYPKRFESRRGSKDSVVLNDYQDMSYIGEMSIGTPPQKFAMLFDSGSADLWVPAKEYCKTNAQYCTSHHAYDHEASTTYKSIGKPFTVTYGTGKMSGTVSNDVIQVSGMKITNQSFGESTVLDKMTEHMQFDGIFGLAYPALSSLGVDPPFVSMMKQGLLDQPMFAFYLSSPGNKGTDGQITFGGVNPDRYEGNFVWTPVIRQLHWLIKVDAFDVIDKRLAIDFAATPDSGTSFIKGPSHVFEKVNTILGAHFNAEVLKNYQFKCDGIDKLREVTFWISGEPLVLTPYDYIVPVKKDQIEYCVSGFQGEPNLELVILGDVFMRKYYTVFDMGYNRVGFALAYPAPTLVIGGEIQRRRPGGGGARVRVGVAPVGIGLLMVAKSLLQPTR